MKPPTDRTCQLCRRDGHAWYELPSGRVAWLCRGTKDTPGCGTDYFLLRAADKKLAKEETKAS